MVEPQEKIDIQKSKEAILKKVIDFVIITLNYHDSVMALTLLSIQK